MWGLIDEKYCKNDFWAKILKDIVKKVNPNEQISSKILSDFQRNIDIKKLSSKESKSIKPNILYF